MSGISRVAPLPSPLAEALTPTDSSSLSRVCSASLSSPSSPISLCENRASEATKDELFSKMGAILEYFSSDPVFIEKIMPALQRALLLIEEKRASWIAEGKYLAKSVSAEEVKDADIDTFPKGSEDEMIITFFPEAEDPEKGLISLWIEDKVFTDGISGATSREHAFVLWKTIQIKRKHPFLDEEEIFRTVSALEENRSHLTEKPHYHIVDAEQDLNVFMDVYASKLFLFIKGVLIDYESGDFALKERIVPLSSDELDHLYHYIYTHRMETIAKIAEKGMCDYARPFQSGGFLARAVLTTRKQNPILILNRKPHPEDPTHPSNDTIVGLGSFKIVTYGIDLLSGEKLISASCKGTSDVEINNLIKYKDVPGFVQLLDYVRYPCKVKDPTSGACTLDPLHFKTRMLLTRYKKGNLGRAIETLNEAQKLHICKSLIRAVCTMHAKGDIHRDLKPDNVLLDEECNPYISDLASLCAITDRTRRSRSFGTRNYYSPEYAAVLLRSSTYTIEEKREKIATTSSFERDIWCLGLILYQVLDLGPLPWVSLSSTDKLILLASYAESKVDWFKEPEDKASLTHLVWQMVRVDVTERITTDQLASLSV